VLAAGGGNFGWDERLHAEADAVDAGVTPGAGQFGGHGAGRSFDGGLAPRPAGDGSEQRPERGWRDAVGRTSAEVDGFRLPGPEEGGDFGAERGEIPVFQLARKHPGGEVTEGAFLRAEGEREVNARHVPFWRICYFGVEWNPHACA
jgi:hypothetical protein